MAAKITKKKPQIKVQVNWVPKPLHNKVNGRIFKPLCLRAPRWAPCTKKNITNNIYQDQLDEYKKYAAPRAPRWTPYIENKLFKGEITN